MNKKTKKIIIIVSIFLIVAGLSIGIGFGIKSNISTNKPVPPNTYPSIGITVNEIRWKVEYDPSNNNIKTISANYSENEKSSKYYEQLKLYYGDSSVYVTHNYQISGVPIGDNWYRLTKTETIYNGWDSTEIFSKTRYTYEEYLEFNF